jgi:prolyl 4-hydroxylase
MSTTRIELFVTALSVMLALATVGCIVFALCYRIENGTVQLEQSPPSRSSLPVPKWPDVEVMHESAPFIYRLKGFLSSEECQHLIGVCKPKFKRSQVIDHSTGGNVEQAIRTSSSCFMGRAETETIGAVEKRAAEVLGVPVENIETLQMVRYYPGQKYDAHHDFFHHFGPRDNQRYATVLVYLNDDFEGGSTDFPKVGVSAQPKEGDGVLWFSCWRPGCRVGSVGCTSKACKCFDESLHLGAPPKTGVKYALNVWVRFEHA